MRITGGTARGCRLATPKSAVPPIRPTSDRTREALFNILGTEVCDARVLDLFCGTGAMGIEALSRGAALAVFVDRSRRALELVHANLGHCLGTPKASLLQLDLARPGSEGQLRNRISDDLVFDLVFLDPPYEKKLALQALQMVESTGILHPDAMVVVEERKNTALPDQCGSLLLTDRRTYGETGLWLYNRTSRNHRT
jgi:16S rRNA (guanine966-N2)-methyltransferase